MKISIIWNLYTDGDFSLKNYEKYNCLDFDGYERYFGIKEFENEDDFRCMDAARTFLEQMLCDMHVSYTHYYILRDLYEMFEPLIDFISKRKPGVEKRYMSGNYNGTDITVAIQ